MRSIHRSVCWTLCGCVALVGACVELPLEQTNYLDRASGSRLRIEGAPDTLNSAGETFEVTLVSSPRAPSYLQDPVVRVSAGIEVLEWTSGTSFRSRPTIGLIPITAKIRAYVPGVPDGPTHVLTIVLRQRPALVEVECEEIGCTTIGGLQQERSLSFRLRDALGETVNLPAGTYRYGEVLSRSPGIVSVIARPTPAGITVRSESVGSAWIVVLGAAGVADSLLVSITP